MSQLLELTGICAILESHGDHFLCGDAHATCMNWLAAGFNASQVNAWCTVGVWEPQVAAFFRDRGDSPAAVNVSELLIVRHHKCQGNDCRWCSPVTSMCEGRIPYWAFVAISTSLNAQFKSN